MVKKKKIILITIILIAICLGSFLSWQIIFRSGYYALYLSSGDIYFGKLVLFSHYTLKNPYFLRITQDKENPISLQPFQGAFWGPGKKLKFNPKHVIWISKLAPTSQVINYIESQKTAGALPTGMMPSTPSFQLPPAETATSSQEK